MFRNLKDTARALKAWRQYLRLRKDIETMGSKNIIVSKTFWLNVLGLAATIGGLLPQKWSVPVLTVANIGLRLVTNQPVNLFPKSGNDQ